ncbi:MAG: glycerol-3-phosphate 1-O-acyltransferase PlsY [Anaeromyxobacteraceae bacterium]
MSLTVKLALLVGAYLLGSVPFGVVLTRLFTGKDVRTVGSGNIGASNVTRAAGKAAGVLTLVLDAAKASVPMLATRAFLADEGDAALTWATLVGVAAFVGHIYPVWLGFKGGKGVATALGVYMVLSPWPSLLALVVFGAVVGLTRVPALGSLAGTAVITVGTFISYGGSSFVSWAALAVALVIVLRHRANIERLVKGAEHKV